MRLDAARRTVTFAFVPRKKKNRGSKPLQSIVLDAPEEVSWDDLVSWQEMVVERLPESMSSTRRLLVLVNPVSGKGRAMRIFSAHVEPILLASGRPFDVTVTQRAGHAHAICSQLDVHDLDCVMSIGGDGLLHEIVNGLMSNDSYLRERQRVSLAVVPAGSGNGLSKSLGLPDVPSAALAAVRGVDTPLDLMALDSTPAKAAPAPRTAAATPLVVAEDDEAPADRVVYSFLSLTWAIVADVDLESEKYRWMGAARFTFAAIQRILALRQYTGKLEVKPVREEWKPSTCTGLHCEYCMAHRSTDVELASASASSASAPTSASSSTSASTSADDGGTSSTSASASTSNSASTAPFRRAASHAPLMRHMGHLAEAAGGELGKGWDAFSGEFVLLCVTNVAWIAADTQISPSAHLADGALDITWIQQTGKTALLKTFLKVEEGKHVDSRRVLYEKAVAWRLTPSDEPASGKRSGPGLGNLSVDGERLPVGQVWGEVLPSAVRIVVPDEPYEC